jgi:hypothetical protein
MLELADEGLIADQSGLRLGRKSGVSRQSEVASESPL